MINEFKGDYEFLSNFSDSAIIYNGYLYPTAEHAFQAAKTLNLKEQEKVREAPTPSQAKRIGRKVQLRPDWEKIKEEIMYDIVRLKFVSNPELAKKLFETEDNILVEGNTWGDIYWGMCNGTGKNKLGRILMTVRKELFEVAEVYDGLYSVYEEIEEFLKGE